MDYRIEVVPYNPEWARLAQEEIDLLKEVLGDTAQAVYHVGSTSVEGIKAKPILDFLVVVKNLEVVELCTEALVKAGYQPRGEFGLPGRLFFTKDQGDRRTHHVHIFEAGHPEVEMMLDFRDYLSTHPSDAALYGELKVELAQRFQNDRASYRAGKDPLIQELLKRANRWREANRKDGENLGEIT